jgi:subfamily B ATP-binding cassette protein MsbA
MKSWWNKNLALTKLLLPLAKQHRWMVAAMIFLGLLEALFEGIGISLFIPFLYSLDFQLSQSKADDWVGQSLNQVFALLPVSDRLLFITLIIFGLIIFKGVVSYANGILFSWFDMRLSENLCGRVVDQILSVGMRFIERTRSGKLLNMLEAETYTTSQAVATVIEFVIALLTIAMFVALMLLLSWQITLIVLSALLLISVFVKWLTRRVKSLSRAGLLADQTFSQRAFELLSGTRIIRAFGQEDRERQRFLVVQQRVHKANLALDKISGLIEPVSEVMAAAVLLIVLFFALQMQNSAHLPLVLVFILILYRLQPQLAFLETARYELDEASAPVKSVMQFLRRDDKPYIHSGSVVFTGLRDCIRFDGVSYAYESTENAALSDLSFTIKKGETTAIVGLSGAGKSTLIDLLIRFYDPTNGSIFVDGIALPEFDIATWRARLAVVNQNAGLFNTTMRENIAYGRPGATDSEIVTAAQQASAHEFIQALPSGYDTLVGDQGTRLSSGQQQRIAIARAIVREPEILILDEATSTLDSLSEQAIKDSLATFQQGRTVIIVAHRLSTVELADRILVLDAGRLVEQGNTKQLLENNGLFAKLYQLQSLGSDQTQKTE